MLDVVIFIVIVLSMLGMTMAIYMRNRQLTAEVRELRRKASRLDHLVEENVTLFSGKRDAELTNMRCQRTIQRLEEELKQAHRNLEMVLNHKN